MKIVKSCLVSLLMIVSFLLPGCANPNAQTDDKSLSVQDECVKLWDINLGEDYIINPDGTYFARWSGDDLSLDLFVRRGNLSDDDLTNFPSIASSATPYNTKY